MPDIEITTFHGNLGADRTTVHVKNEEAGVLLQQQPQVTELQPQNYTQVGGVYGLEIRPQFLSSIDNVQLTVEGFVTEDRQPRFFRIK